MLCYCDCVEAAQRWGYIHVLDIYLQSHVVWGQFVCIAQQDYWRILNHVEKNTHKVEEEGEIVMVKEHRELDRSGTRKGHIVIKVNFFLCFPLIY